MKGIWGNGLFAIAFLTKSIVGSNTHLMKLVQLIQAPLGSYPSSLLVPPHISHNPTTLAGMRGGTVPSSDAVHPEAAQRIRPVTRRMVVPAELLAGTDFNDSSEILWSNTP